MCIINYIDESTVKTKKETIQEINVLLEQQRSQFNTFGEGLQQLNDKMDRHILENHQGFQQMTERIDHLVVENRQDHRQMKLMIQELAVDQKEIKQKVTDLDQEFETKIRRVK